jgi:hypothetical protein
MCYVASMVAKRKIRAGSLKVDHGSRAIQTTMIPMTPDSTWLRVRTKAWGTDAVSALGPKPSVCACWRVILFQAKNVLLQSTIEGPSGFFFLSRNEKLLLLMFSIAG